MIKSIWICYIPQFFKQHIHQSILLCSIPVFDLFHRYPLLCLIKKRGIMMIIYFYKIPSLTYLKLFTICHHNIFCQYRRKSRGGLPLTFIVRKKTTTKNKSLASNIYLNQQNKSLSRLKSSNKQYAEIYTQPVLYKNWSTITIFNYSFYKTLFFF
jgi:hypothetical protein